MRFFTHWQAVRAIESLKSVPAYSDILQLERLDEESAANDQAGQQLLDLCRFEASKVEGKVPPKGLGKPQTPIHLLQHHSGVAEHAAV